MGGLFKSPKIPEPPPPQVMPDPDNLAVKIDQKNMLSKARARAGRTSTILSGGDTQSSYSGTTLGQA